MPQFSLLTLNTFGLPFFLARSRLRRLAPELASLDPTVLCLQEIQQDAYVPWLRRWLPQYPHVAYGPNRLAPKGGLLTLSQAPLVSSNFIPYVNRGRLWSVGYADWILQKGVLTSEIQIGAVRIVILNTHLQANYSGDWQLTNPTAHIEHDQVRQLAAMIRAQPADALVIACGDFNFPRSAFLYDELIHLSGASDPLASENLPTWRLPLGSKKWAVVLDYILLRGLGENAQIHAEILPLANSNARWPHERFLSDHCALILHGAWE